MFFLGFYGSGISLRSFTVPEEQWIIVNFSTGPLVDQDTGVDVPKMHKFLSAMIKQNPSCPRCP